MQLAFAGVQRGAELEPKLADARDDRLGTADRARGTVEGREEAVGVELLTAVPGELPANRRMMAREQVAPRAVAELGSPLRRADDVGEEDGGEHAVRNGRFRPAAEEALDPT